MAPLSAWEQFGRSGWARRLDGGTYTNQSQLDPRPRPDDSPCTLPFIIHETMKMKIEKNSQSALKSQKMCSLSQESCHF